MTGLRLTGECPASMFGHGRGHTLIMSGQEGAGADRKQVLLWRWQHDVRHETHTWYPDQEAAPVWTGLKPWYGWRGPLTGGWYPGAGPGLTYIVFCCNSDLGLILNTLLAFLLLSVSQKQSARFNLDTPFRGLGIVVAGSLFSQSSPRVRGLCLYVVTVTPLVSADALWLRAECWPRAGPGPGRPIPERR